VPNLKDIRRRIGSVQKTQQITRAMRMVAAAKLRRAQEAIAAARPYAVRMRETLRDVAAGSSGEVSQPLLAARENPRRGELVVITSDRGLCGAFNANVLKAAQATIAERGAGLEEVTLTLVGSKARDFFRRRKIEASKAFTDLQKVEYSHAVEIADHVAARFVDGDVDRVWLVHSEFVSTMTQTPRVVDLLPLAAESDEAAVADGTKTPYTIEPDAEQLLQALAPKALQTEIYRALLESQAGEHAARMTAMESATRNTEELISRLTLEYNRARQAAITRELVEIVSGAEAL
jgi:F-type H+-transporting ATPase subunit gamma